MLERTELIQSVTLYDGNGDIELVNSINHSQPDPTQLNNCR